MSDVTLYGLPPSTYTRTGMLILAAKGVPYRLERRNFRDPSYRAIHPFARMPTLDHGAVRIYEALAIGTYVDAVFDGPALQPSDPLARARMMQWISVVNDYGQDTVVQGCLVERVIKPMRGQDPDLSVVAAAMPEISHYLGVLDAALADAPYLAGPDLSLADLFAAPPLAYFAACPEGADLSETSPNLATWLARMRALPYFDEINPVD